MADRSLIEWTDATWNPVTGCTKITRGCDNCYAERIAERFRGTPGHPFERGFELTLRPERLGQPLSWKKPRMIFVNSMSDLFHKRVPRTFIDSVFDTMERADRHVFQVLTKRSSLMRHYLRSRYGDGLAPRHIWCGVSVEDERGAARIQHLRHSRATVRFLSIEPLLGPMGKIDLKDIAWVIVGGESGPKARPMEEAWVLDIRRQCGKAGVPFFFKQWSGRTPKAGGQLLDGQEHNAMPAYRREFKLDLIDGFCGGGVYRDGNDLLVGSPLIMLEESQAAKVRLSRGRTKPPALDFKHYFIDREQAHADYLNRELANRGHLPSDDISVHVGEFERLAPAIIDSIKRRQPRAGRSIFLLDQCGYTDVGFPLIRRILSELPAAEVIVTIAVDALFNFMSTTPRFLRSVAPLSLGEDQIRAWLEQQSEHGRAVVQRAFRRHMRDVTGAGFDTPFFIRPAQSRRALWFVHLSRHPTARDVMIQRHWAERSTFEHYGPAGLRMMGWDALDNEPDLFRFADDDKDRLHTALLEGVPPEIHALASETPVSVETMRFLFANETAARFQDLDEAVIDLFRGKEVDVLDADGRRRGSGLKHLRHDDRIALPHQLTLWTPRSERRFGAMKDQIVVDDDILDPSPEEELARWEGKSE